MVVSIPLPEGAHESGSQQARDDLRQRILETVALTDRRGYGVPLDTFCALLYGGSAPPEIVESLIAEIPELTVEEGLVLRSDMRARAGEMAARQLEHATEVPFAERVAEEFVEGLVASCPYVRSVSLTGSATSGGFAPRDDVDLNLIVRDGTKYIVYLWALARSIRPSLKYRSKMTDAMGDLPFVPKVVCINVVWEESQVRPFRRTDKWLAYELLLHRPLFGQRFHEDVQRENPWLLDHFPQLAGAGSRATSRRGAAGSPARRSGAFAFFERLERRPRLFSAAEALSRFLVISAHRVVSLTRSRNPEAREREAFVNTVKRPYSVYDIPGTEETVPEQALRPRESAKAHGPSGGG